MASAKSLVGFLLLVLTLSSHFSEAQAQLSANYYDASCPNLRAIVANAFLLQLNVTRLVAAPASLMRIAFHDCAVDGCQASNLLSSQPGVTDEKLSPRNLGLNNVDIILNIKQTVEQSCPGIVSCADLIVLVAHEAIKYSAGPILPLEFGRKDAKTASTAAATNQLLGPDASVQQVLDAFAKMNIGVSGTVALLGSHTLGVAHCANIVGRLYPPDATLSQPQNFAFLAQLQAQCPQNYNPNTFVQNDVSNTLFDSAYYQGAMTGRGLLAIDDQLARDPNTRSIVQNWAINTIGFRQEFQNAFLQMTRYKVLTGTGPDREVRRDCRFVNS
ncbi:hypothetical protein R1sor_019543 [Riccia sorocarpa]|uniref:Peroxidase n=1 Tax=Riccia sorocarpa TaxID=122646 RepID=A0ABD3IDW7_9MARC